MKLIAVPHQFFESKEGYLIHFNEETLALTELDPLHRVLLGEFSEARTRDEVAAAYEGDEDIAEALDELIDVELVGR